MTESALEPGIVLRYVMLDYRQPRRLDPTSDIKLMERGGGGNWRGIMLKPMEGFPVDFMWSIYKEQIEDGRYVVVGQQDPDVLTLTCGFPGCSNTFKANAQQRYCRSRDCQSSRLTERLIGTAEAR